MRLYLRAAPFFPYLILVEQAERAKPVRGWIAGEPGGKTVPSWLFDQRIFRRGIRMEYRSWMCLICGWIYDEEAGLPEEGIGPGTRWEDVPINWTCPECGARKEDFEMVQI